MSKLKLLMLRAHRSKFFEVELQGLVCMFFLNAKNSKPTNADAYGEQQPCAHEGFFQSHKDRREEHATLPSDRLQLLRECNSKRVPQVTQMALIVMFGTSLLQQGKGSLLRRQFFSVACHDDRIICMMISNKLTKILSKNRN